MRIIYVISVEYSKKWTTTTKTREECIILESSRKPANGLLV